jgi:hypothetical protein
VLVINHPTSPLAPINANSLMISSSVLDSRKPRS